jgi:Ca2+-transporting ATPase
MTTLHATRAGVVAYSKGATDRVLADCDRHRLSGADVVLTPADREHILEREREMASEGLRVLAIATKTDATEENAEKGMTLLGLVAMMDPPRAEAQAAVQTCAAAGIVPVMITGDHPLTARAVAREVGILGARCAGAQEG